MVGSLLLPSEKRLKEENMPGRERYPLYSPRYERFITFWTLLTLPNEKPPF